MSREEHGTSTDVEQPSRLAALTGRLAAAASRSRPLRVAGVTLTVAAVAVAALLDGGGPLAGLTGRDDARADAAPSRTPSPSPTPAPTGDEVPTSDLPTDVGLLVEVTGDGREGGDLTHVYATVTVRNRGGVDRRIESVRLVGLGTAVVERPPDAPLPAGGSLDLATTITADCEALYERRLEARVTETGSDGRRFDVRAAVSKRTAAADVLRPMCPDVVPGLHVAVVAAQSLPGGATTVRLVNHGNLSALVTPRATPDAGGLRLAADPPLPFDLGPGQAVIATLDVRAADGTDGCPAAPAKAAAEALFLEAETPYGFTAVTNFPTTTIRTAVSRVAGESDCPPVR